MLTYTPPVRDMLFALTELNDLHAITALEGYSDATPELAQAVLDEAGRFASKVLAPINESGDREGARWNNGKVSMPKGFSEAYAQFCAGGWNGFDSPPEFGGQGMPRVLATAVMEMWKGANLSFSLAPTLTIAAVDALELRASDDLKKRYLHKLISGEWTGTMNLTEPQAGTDLGLLRTKAVKQADGSYKISGQKIFITYGEHEMTENIVHLVLARTADAPEGVKGISIFIVPKFLVNADGTLGARNDVNCISIEHKLGIHGSPTCVLSYGDQGGATGYIIGDENTGLSTMFIMMNKARFVVGLEGIGLAELAYQKALGYARTRVQSRDLMGSKDSVTLIHHPDIRRMLMRMKSCVEAMRGLAMTAAWYMDLGARHPDAAERKQHQALAELLIPVVKGWSTETAIQVASLGVQVHGGMGFIEETGAAQILRDARITTIYEGTTGIQANDLIGRKLARDNGATMKALIELMQADVAKLTQHTNTQARALGPALGAGIAALANASTAIGGMFGSDIKGAHMGAVPLLELTGIVAGGWILARSALIAAQRIAAGDADPIYPSKLNTAQFFAEHVLPHAGALCQAVCSGGHGALHMQDAHW